MAGSKTEFDGLKMMRAELLGWELVLDEGPLLNEDGLPRLASVEVPKTRAAKGRSWVAVGGALATKKKQPRRYCCVVDRTRKRRGGGSEEEERGSGHVSAAGVASVNKMEEFAGFVVSVELAGVHGVNVGGMERLRLTQWAGVGASWVEAGTWQLGELLRCCWTSMELRRTNRIGAAKGFFRSTMGKGFRWFDLGGGGGKTWQQMASMEGEICGAGVGKNGGIQLLNGQRNMKKNEKETGAELDTVMQGLRTKKKRAISRWLALREKPKKRETKSKNKYLKP